jgi:hypothetical protein
MRLLLSPLLTLSLLANLLSAQGSTTFTISLYNNKNQPMGNTPITLIESTTKERIVKNTDGTGKVTFVLTTGREWNVNILQIKNHSKVKVPENGKSTGSTRITYDYADWERRHRPSTDRSMLNLTTVNQKDVDPNAYTPKEATVEIHVTKISKAPLVNFPVSLTCYKLGKTFTANTNSSGNADLLVPVNNEYEVDIDGVEEFDYMDIGNESGSYSLAFTYEPTAIKETVKKDTITQVLTNVKTGTSGRCYAKFHISNFDKGEYIYIDMLKSNKVYKALIDANGNAEFLLPIKKKYMINFVYEREVDVLDLSDFKGISEYEMTVKYQPDLTLKYPEQYLQSPEQLMIADFKKFFDKQFPPPKPTDAIGLHLMWYDPEVNAESKEAVLEIGFNIPDGTADVSSGPPLNICFVIDKSGSMEGSDKIEMLKQAMLKYTKELRKTDIVSLVSFDDNFAVAMPSQKLGDGSYLRDMIEDLKAGGGTNIFSGLEEGYKQVLKNMIPGGTNRVVLLTDGYDGIPIDSTVGMSKGYNSKGIELSCIGVGQGYNAALLTQLATVGGGLLQFAGKGDDLDEVFAKEMSSILKPVAKDVTVEIEYNGKLIYKQLYGFPTVKTSNGLVKMELKNLYRGLNTLALVDFELKEPTQDIEKQPVTVRLSYFDFKKNAQATVMEQAWLKWSAGTGKMELVLDQQKKKMYAVAITNQSLKAMGDAFVKGDYTAVKLAVDSALRQLKELFPTTDDKDIKELVKSMETYTSSLKKVILIKKQTKK